MAITVNVLLVVDTKETIAGSTMVYATSDHSKKDGGEGDALVINANRDDTIVWRATAINQVDQIDLIDFTSTKGDLINPQLQRDGSWEGWVRKSTGAETYQISFKIGEDGSYSWSGMINSADD